MHESLTGPLGGADILRSERAGKAAYRVYDTIMSDESISDIEKREEEAFWSGLEAWGAVYYPDWLQIKLNLFSDMLDDVKQARRA